jgi:uncharacterized heparinase superfamily protein
MTRIRLTLAALGAPTARGMRGVRRRLGARRAWAAGDDGAPHFLPDAFLYGDSDRGRALVAGDWRPFGRPVPLGERTIWDAALEGPRLEAERHRFGWLDDLAALGTRAARTTAQTWTLGWIGRFGRGRGVGWRPETAGARVLHWAAHARFLAEGLPPSDTARLWRALDTHGPVLLSTWGEAEPGLPQLQALAGAVIALALDDAPDLPAATAALGTLADSLVLADGATPYRAPGELAEIVIVLIWTARLLETAGRHAATAHLHAIARALPVLRALRLGDGTMARFNGGGPGAPDRLDQALAELRVGPQPKPRLPMGFARLAGGRLVAILDGAAPPMGRDARRGQAGTLAFELSVGRSPLVVNSGPGDLFGVEAANFARSTAAHSTVEIDGASSARLSPPGLAARAYGRWLASGPALVSVRQAQDHTGQWLLATHDGYVESHGLLHERRLFVDSRGRECRGEEIVYVTDGRARDRFDRIAAARNGRPVALTARFHLAPGIQAEADGMRQSVDLVLPDGDEWSLRAAGGRVEVAESVYFDPDQAAPVPTLQILVIAEIIDYLGQVNWSFTRRPGPDERRQGVRVGLPSP